MSNGIVNQTVEDIMRERGVGKRWAYAILRDMSQEQATRAPIPHNQRERVLEVLYRSEVRDSRALTKALHDEGYEIDGHDTTKVLWSLQKTNHVKFREHQNPRYLYAIKLTDQGKSEAHRLVTAEVPEEELFDQDRPDLVEEAATIVETPPAPEPQPEPQPEPAFSLDEFPALSELVERSRKAQKLAEAARILEEAGEDDIALNLMGKTEFTNLEKEVLVVLQRVR